MRLQELFERGGALIVIGAGGHGKVVLRAIRESLSQYKIDELIERVIVLDDDPSKIGAEVAGFRVLGSREVISRLSSRFSLLGLHVAIGDNRLRSEIYTTYSWLSWITVVHPTAVLESEVGPGSFVGPLAYVGVDSKIGRGVIVNTKASIDHDCFIGDWVHIAPGVTLGGEVYVGSGTLIGIGSSCIPRVRIGEWSLIGAGSAVVRDIPPKSKAFGVPARVRGEA